MLVGGRISILWVVGKVLCPGIESIYTLARCMQVVEYTDIGKLVGLLVLIGCRWTEDLLASFTRLFDGALVGVAIFI